MDYAAARQKMLDGQVRTYNVVDPQVIDAFGRVPRETFVPVAERARAYFDIDVPIATGRTMMQPMVLARMLQALGPLPDDIAMVVGAGTGYSAAILSRLVSKVVAVENDPALVKAARVALAGVGAENVQVIEGSPSNGDRKYAPYDVILIDGALSNPPHGLLEQLAEGGRMVGVLFEDGIGRATVWQKNRAGVAARRLFDANARFVSGLAPELGFVF